MNSYLQEAEQFTGPPIAPFVWDKARRFQLRCELDTAYILDTFPIVRRKDEAAHGTYRTRDTILALYDQFAEASISGKAFTLPLNPPPGDILACHPPNPVHTQTQGAA